MFVKSLEILEFRGIKDSNGPLKFSNFTVLIGRNSSGKSTILEALSLLPHPGILDVIQRDSKLNTLYKIHSGPKSRLLYLYAGDSRLYFHVGNSKINFELDQKGFKVYAQGDLISSKNNIAKYIGTDVSYLEGYVIFIPSSTDILDKLENHLKNLKEILTKKNLHIKLANVLNEFVNDKYTEIVFLEPISLRKVYGNDSTAFLRLSELGSGIEKVIKVMALLEAYSPSLVIIDDFEAGLHPSLIKGFLKWLNEKKWQKIISTHSIDVLYHLLDINPKDTTILQLNKSNEDILTHKILTLEQLEDIMNANLDPRSLVDTLNL